MYQLESINLLGNSSIGIFATATNKYAIFPHNIKDNAKIQAEKTLQVPIIQTYLVASRLVGLFSVGNSHNIILPNLITDDEYDNLKRNIPDDVNLHVLDSKITALGNAIVCSDDAALLHPEFTSSEKKLIEDFLDVEIASKHVMNSPLVGSMIFRNDKGLLAHPLIILMN